MYHYFSLLDKLSHKSSPWTAMTNPLFLTGRGSGVLSHVVRLNFLINSTSAILASIRANLLKICLCNLNQTKLHITFYQCSFLVHLQMACNSSQQYYLYFQEKISQDQTSMDQSRTLDHDVRPI